MRKLTRKGLEARGTEAKSIYQQPAREHSNLMLSVRKNIDGLWHCLRPKLSTLILGSANQPSLFTRELILRNHFFPQCHFHSVKSPRHNGCNPTDQKHTYSHNFLRNRSIQSVDGDSQEKWGRQAPGDQRIYEDLRRLAVKGNFVQVERLVNEIIKTRGEKLDSRIYLAMVSANACAHNGSPAEVRRLLEQMAKDNIEPDSAMYHAVLKVIDEEIIQINPC